MTSKVEKAVIMADDDEEDCLLAQDAFLASGAKANFSCVEDGLKLINYLSEQSNKSKLPDLILLDLNMPCLNGREALKEIRREKNYNHIPIVIFTTSSEKADKEFSLKAGADDFITKPSSFNDLVKTMKSLDSAWLGSKP